MLTYWIVYSSAFMQAKTTLGYNPQDARVFAENLASEIAKGDMHADGWNEHTPILEPDDDNPTPHWQTTEQALTQVENATTPEEFGFALHGYQDSFSHWRKLTADPNYNLGNNPSATDIYNAHRDCWFSGDCQIDYWTPWDNEIDQEMYEGMLQLIDDYVADYIADIETQEGQTEAE